MTLRSPPSTGPAPKASGAAGPSTLISPRPRRPRGTDACTCARPCARHQRIARFMRYGEELRFKRGQLMWDRGDEADSLLAVCVGFVKLSVPTAGGEVILDVLGRGSLVGPDAALETGRRPMRCVALSAGRGMRIDAAHLHLVLRDDPELLAELLKICCHRTAHFAERMARVGEGTVAQRMAQVLIALGVQFGLQDARGTFIPVRLSRADLASLAGCRPETAIRQLSTWRAEGVVDSTREGIVIRDMAALRVATR